LVDKLLVCYRRTLQSQHISSLNSGCRGRCDLLALIAIIISQDPYDQGQCTTPKTSDQLLLVVWKTKQSKALPLS